MRHSANDPTDDQRARDERLAALLRASATGDGAAFEQFYEATARYVLSVIRRITGESLAEDVMAETFFQAWRSAASFDSGRGSALTWLLTIARSRALDRLRQELVRHGGLGGAPEFDPDACEGLQAIGPDELLESVEMHTRLHSALAGLAASERWVLGLAYFRDFSQSEIAAITQMPLGTVKSLMTRAQRKLKDVLQSPLPSP